MAEESQSEQHGIQAVQIASDGEESVGRNIRRFSPSCYPQGEQHDVDDQDCDIHHVPTITANGCAQIISSRAKSDFKHYSESKP